MYTVSRSWNAQLIHFSSNHIWLELLCILNLTNDIYRDENFPPLGHFYELSGPLRKYSVIYGGGGLCQLPNDLVLVSRLYVHAYIALGRCVI